MKLYLVNENPDGSGAWLEPVSDRGELWSSAGGMFYVSRSSAEYAVTVFGGHVVEFTASEWASDYGTPVPVYVGDPPPAPPAEREPDAIMVCRVDGSLDWRYLMPWPLSARDLNRLELHGSNTRKVYLDAPPAPAPPWRDQLCAVLGWDVPLPDDAYAVQRALTEVSRLKGREETCEALLAKAPEEVSRLKEDLDTALRDSRKLLEERKIAQAEVSRLSKALDGEKRAYAGAAKELIGTKLELERWKRGRLIDSDLVCEDGTVVDDPWDRLDELAKQEPVAWRADHGEGLTLYTVSVGRAAAWRDAGYDVEPLYAAPKPAEQAPGGFNGPLTRKYAAMEDARDLNTCAACNAGPDMIGPVHTCEQVPDEVHESGWQWRPVSDGAFAPPFGTINKCRACGCLVAGGPTACGRCADKEGPQLPADAPATNEPGGSLGSWCPQCGPDVGVDEDGLCTSCGATAVGDGADHAIRLLRREAAPADTPAMVEADRLIREGWLIASDASVHHSDGRRQPVGVAVVDAMRALRGGK